MAMEAPATVEITLNATFGKSDVDTEFIYKFYQSRNKHHQPEKLQHNLRANIAFFNVRLADMKRLKALSDKNIEGRNTKVAKNWSQLQDYRQNVK